MTQFDKDKFDGEQAPQIDGEKAPQVSPPGIREELSEEELKALVETPSVFCSRFYVSMQDGACVRLYFADASQHKDPKSQFMVPRFACVMSIAGYMNLAQMIQNTSAQIMQRLMQMNQAPGGVPQPIDPNREKLD